MRVLSQIPELQLAVIATFNKKVSQGQTNNVSLYLSKHNYHNRDSPMLLSMLRNREQASFVLLRMSFRPVAGLRSRRKLM